MIYTYLWITWSSERKPLYMERRVFCELFINNLYLWFTVWSVNVQIIMYSKSLVVQIERRQNLQTEMCFKFRDPSVSFLTINI